MRRLHKFLSLTRRERILFYEAAALLFASHLSVKLLPFRHIESFLNERWSNRVPSAVEHARDIRLIRQSVSRAASLFPWRSLCLSRSIAEFVMLRRRGIAATLVAGVKFAENASLAAHAWVQADPAGEAQEEAGFVPVIGIGRDARVVRAAPRQFD